MSKHWFISHIIEKYTKEKILGIDLGVGKDNWHGFKNCEMIGIDQKLGKDVDIVSDLEFSLPFKDEAFDVAIAINSLNYIKNSYYLCKEINRVLKPQAIFVCVVDNEKSNCQPFVWTREYLNRILEITGFKSIFEIKDYLYARWFNLTSVYAFNVVKKIEQKTTICTICGKRIKGRKSNNNIQPVHQKCKSYQIKENPKSCNVFSTHIEY